MDWVTTVLLVCAPIVGLFAGIFAQVVTYMFLTGKPIVFSYAVGFAVGAAFSLVALHAAYPSYGFFDAVIVLLTFGGLNYCYNNFVNLNFSSLRIRLLKELLACGGTESMGMVTSQYGSKAVLGRRLQRLVAWGQLRQEGGRYMAVAGSFLLLALLFDSLKKIMIGHGFRYKNSKVHALEASGANDAGD
jgi:hypothetical protein